MNTIILTFVCLLFACPIMALTLNCVLTSRPLLAARFASYCIGVGFLIALGLLSFLGPSQQSFIHAWLCINTQSVILSCLVLLVSFVVHRFSLKYMHGDRLYRRFFILLSVLSITALFMILADNLLLFWCAWTLSNGFLVLLMVHKNAWSASKNAGLLAFYTLAFGSACLLFACLMLNIKYSTISIWALGEQSITSQASINFLSMGLILLAALTQSGLFPFHRWLISSLNSPTPVSALMHAGLVNGGGILLVKFAPLMLPQEGLLTVLFLLGALSALLGTAWKLMQHDIKKSLACSTMAQMGFMMMQCGLGLFAAAIAHLCWHGLFKAYLFLSSGSAVKQKKPTTYAFGSSLLTILTSLVGGGIAVIAFAFAANKSISLHDASAFVLFFAFIAGAQLMLSWTSLRQNSVSIMTGLVLVSFSGFMYGASIQVIQNLIPNISMLQGLTLSLIHWGVMAVFGVLWAVFNFGLYNKISQSAFGCRLYMYLFNASQPSRKTVTTIRNDYNY